MIPENLNVFMQDFGVMATWYGAPWAIDRSGASIDSSRVGPAGLQTQTALVLFDQPDEDENGHVQSRGYKMTFPSLQFIGIKRADAVLIGSGSYSVIQPKQIDDGAFTETMLEAI